MQCEFCGERTPGIDAHISHLQQFHRNRPNLLLPCGHPGCPKTFLNFSSRRSHISRKHGARAPPEGEVVNVLAPEPDQQNAEDIPMNEIFPINERVDQPGQLLNNGEDIPMHDINRINEGVPRNEGEPQQPQIVHPPVVENVAEFILNLRVHNIPDVTIQSIVQNCESLIESSLLNLCHQIDQRLQELQGIELREIINVEETVAQINSAFAKINTKFKQDSYFKRHFSVVPVREVVLGNRVERKPPKDLSDNRASEVKRDVLTYVSLVDVLKSLLMIPEFQELIKNQDEEDPADDTILRSFMDGTAAKKNILLIRIPGCLPLLLYCDDFNINDTASSRPIIMTAFYFTLANFAAKHKSALKFINLVAVVESDLVQFYGMTEILRPIIADLKKMEAGITLADERIIHATLTAFTGDNLAVHKVGGFKEGFTALHSCRYCMVIYPVLQVMCKEDPSLIRTAPQYEDQVRLLNSAEGPAREEYSKDFGINRECELNELESFHCTDGLPPDVFHDVLEGSIPRTVFLLLKRFLTGDTKVMTVEKFNQLLAEFDYGYSETKPSEVLPGHLKDGGKLHQTGAQMWSLAIHLPLILGRYVDLEDECWVNFTTLLKVTSLTFATQISLAMVAYMELLIEEYLATFQHLYGLPLTPKQHYLVHYPSLTLKFGPLFQFNTFRMEAKHRYFKELMRKQRNVVNPAKSMANRHQLYQTFVTRGPLAKVDSQGVVKIIHRNQLAYRDVIPEDRDTVTTVSFVCISGISYKPRQCFVVIDYVDNLPRFGLLLDVIFVNAMFVAVVEKCETYDYDLHFNAYRISADTQQYEMRPFENLFVPFVYHAHNVEGKRFIVMKRSVGDLH